MRRVLRRATPGTAADNHAAVEIVAAVEALTPPGDQGGLVSLCVTVLLAVLVALGVVRRSGMSLVVPQLSSAPPVTRKYVAVLPQLCALRL